MVAGYVDGRYRWSAADWARFPRAIKVRIAVFASTNDGHVLDVETGDATPAQVPGWVQRRRLVGVEPVVYVNRSNIGAVRNACTAARIAVPPIWLSTLDGSRPWGPGIVAIQYAGASLSGGHYDLSDVNDQWPGLAPPILADMEPLYRSDERGPDNNPLVFALEQGALRHLTGAEYALRLKAGAHVVDVPAAELASLPRSSGGRQATVSGQLTLS